MKIGFLCSDSFRVGVHIAFIIFIGEAARLYVSFGISVPEVGLRGNHNMNIAFFEFGNQVVHQVEMLVFEEISLSVCQFHIP